MLSPLPGSLRAFSPAVLIATWFGIGRLPGIPGTYGSLAALPVVAIIHYYYGSMGIAAFALAASVTGTLATHFYLKESDDQDPGPVVIDEVAGQALALMAAPLTWWGYGLAFFLFRGFDILKPGPVGWAERRFKGAFGVMADDLLAGFFTAIMLIGVQVLLEI